MTSANGVIPAGNVSFSPCNKDSLERTEHTLPLEKCPDRTAQITFIQSYQLLRRSSAEAATRQSAYITKQSKVEVKYSNVLQK